MRRAPAYEGAVAPEPVISHLSATVDRAARWRRVVFRTSLAGACVLIAMLAMMILADTAYGGRRVCAAAQKDRVIGFQFHPEKSGPVGLALLKSFLELCED